jgi:hypothetical protein
VLILPALDFCQGDPGFRVHDLGFVLILPALDFCHLSPPPSCTPRQPPLTPPPALVPLLFKLLALGYVLRDEVNHLRVLFQVLLATQIRIQEKKSMRVVRCGNVGVDRLEISGMRYGSASRSHMLIDGCRFAL